jgi:hypothetical protein
VTPAAALIEIEAAGRGFLELTPAVAERTNPGR